MQNYVNLEQTLLRDPERGLQMVADYAGINLREYAAKLLNQSPEEVQSQQDQTIRELRTELASLKQQLGGVTHTIQQQTVKQTEQMVVEFAERHPRFDELADDIKFFLESGERTIFPRLTSWLSGSTPRQRRKLRPLRRKKSRQSSPWLIPTRAANPYRAHRPPAHPRPSASLQSQFAMPLGAQPRRWASTINR